MILVRLCSMVMGLVLLVYCVCNFVRVCVVLLCRIMLNRFSIWFWLVRFSMVCICGVVVLFVLWLIV